MNLLEGDIDPFDIDFTYVIIREIKNNLSNFAEALNIMAKAGWRVLQVWRVGRTSYAIMEKI